MTNESLDRILEDLLYVLPTLHKKILRMDLGGGTGTFRRLHFAIMGTLGENSTKISELAKMLSVTKPQMTFLVEQLVETGIVERHPDDKDRRVIHLVLSEKGRTLLKEMKQKVKNNIKTQLAGLTKDDLQEMAAALDTLRGIVAKL